MLTIDRAEKEFAEVVLLIVMVYAHRLMEIQPSLCMLHAGMKVHSMGLVVAGMVTGLLLPL